MYQGDLRLGDTIDLKVTTSVNGVPTTIAGGPTVAAYVDNGVVEITAGITLTQDFDGRAGLHNVRVAATGGNGFASGTNVQLVFTAGTLNGSSLVGYVIASLSIEKRSVADVTAAAGNLIADALLKRDMGAVAGEAARSLLNAMRFLRNRWRIVGGTLTVYKEDDATAAWSGPVTQTAGNPVSEIDPT